MSTSASAPIHLADEHRALEVLCDDLVNRAESGEWRECDAVWDDFTRRLEAHLELEEKELFPRFADLGPEQAKTVAALAAEHDELRSTVLRLGLAVQEQLLRLSDVQELVEKLRGHAAHENQVFYPWAKTVVLSKPGLSS
jgi:hemerythrin-like domain-containing protein